MPLDASQKEKLFDEAIEASGNMRLVAGEAPSTKVVPADIADALAMEDLPSKNLAGATKTSHLLDFIWDFPDPLNIEEVVGHVQKNRCDLLPEVLRAPAGHDLPEGTVTQIII